MLEPSTTAAPPNPGSPEAVARGCTCPVITNCHGAGVMGNGERNGWWMVEDCPLHGAHPDRGIGPEAKLLPTLWIMRVANGDWYPIQPSDRCKPEDHGRLNDHVVAIEDMDGNVLWRRHNA